MACKIIPKSGPQKLVVAMIPVCYNYNTRSTGGDITIGRCDQQCETPGEGMKGIERIGKRKRRVRERARKRRRDREHNLQTTLAHISPSLSAQYSSYSHSISTELAHYQYHNDLNKSSNHSHRNKQASMN